AGLAEGLQRALPPLLEAALARFVAPALHLRRLDAPLEVRMPGEKERGQRLRLLHDHAAARAEHAGELLERERGVRDVMEHVAAPDPVEASVGGVDRGAVAHAELEPR